MRSHGLTSSPRVPFGNRAIGKIFFTELRQVERTTDNMVSMCRMMSTTKYVMYIVFEAAVMAYMAKVIHETVMAY